MPFAGVGVAGAGHWGTVVIAGAEEQPQGSQEPTNFYLYARKTFKLPSVPTNATLKTRKILSAIL